MKNFIEHVKEDWNANPLSVIDSVAYSVMAVAALKYLRKK